MTDTFHEAFGTSPLADAVADELKRLDAWEPRRLFPISEPNKHKLCQIGAAAVQTGGRLPVDGWLVYEWLSCPERKRFKRFHRLCKPLCTLTTDGFRVSFRDDYEPTRPVWLVGILLMFDRRLDFLLAVSWGLDAWSRKLDPGDVLKTINYKIEF